jgi:hypothetical protein
MRWLDQKVRSPSDPTVRGLLEAELTVAHQTVKETTELVGLDA